MISRLDLMADVADRNSGSMVYPWQVVVWKLNLTRVWQSGIDA